MGDFISAYEFTKRREGGLSEDPLDRGGVTKYGISTGTFESQKKKGLIDRSMKNVKGLSEDKAQTILREQYWDKIWGNALPRDISIALFDTAVNFHPERAIRMLQKILKVKQDSRMGPDTVEAVRKYEGDLVEELLKARFQAHEDDAKENKKQQGHIKGWRDRVARLRHYLRPEAPAPQNAPAGRNPHTPPAGKNPPGRYETPPTSSPFGAFSYLDLARRPIPPTWDPGALPIGPNRLDSNSPLNLPSASANLPFQYSPSGVRGPLQPEQPASTPRGYPGLGPTPSGSLFFPRRNPLSEPVRSMAPSGLPQSGGKSSQAQPPINRLGPWPGSYLEGSPDLPQTGSRNVFGPWPGSYPPDWKNLSYPDLERLLGLLPGAYAPSGRTWPAG